MSDSWFHLDMCLLLTNNSPSLDLPSHLPPLPLVVYYSDRTTAMARKDGNIIRLGLQQHGRVRRIIIQAPSSSLCIWLEAMNVLFPRLGELIVSSTTTEQISPVLPETLQAPDLRRLSLHGIGLPKGLSILSSMTALSILSITQVGASCYFSPGQVVTQLQGLPHLEDLSIGFAIPIPLPNSERELLPAPIPPVTLPSLRRLTFQGVDVYIDNLVAQINTPLLEQLSLTLFFDLTFTLVNLTQLILRTEGFECVVARINFTRDGPFIVAEQLGRGNGKLSLYIHCKPLDWQIDSVTQVCRALGDVVYAMEELRLGIDVYGMPFNWEDILDDMMWHELLLPFIGVKKLRFGSLLTFELSRALNSVTGGLAQELLPELRELVLPETGHEKNTFFEFVVTRNSVGRPVYLFSPFYFNQIGHQYEQEYSFQTPNRLNNYPPDMGLPVFGTLSIDVDDIHKSLIMILEPVTVWRGPRAHNDEPKKERRTHENKRRLRENPQRRANENWRCRELRGSSRNNARISQPGGKKIAI